MSVVYFWVRCGHQLSQLCVLAHNVLVVFFSVLFGMQAFLVSSFRLCCCVNEVFIPSYGLYEIFYILYWGEMMMVHEVV